MDKFKNDIQHKFNQREIQPTDEAWGKITAELVTSRTRKTKTLWLWSGIAAGFIGLLVLLAPLYVIENNTIPVANSEEQKPQDLELKRPSIAPVNQLQSGGIQVSTFNLSKSTSTITRIKPVVISTQTTMHLKPETLLAEVEQELEDERFSEQNINEVDALLAQAKAKLASDQDKELFNQITAESLLAEVDIEDTSSFKDKIWKLIEVNFKELKTSLGAR
jgi:hypothetical protein